MDTSFDLKVESTNPKGSMGLVYLPTFVPYMDPMGTGDFAFGDPSIFTLLYGGSSLKPFWEKDGIGSAHFVSVSFHKESQFFPDPWDEAVYLPTFIITNQPLM